MGNQHLDLASNWLVVQPVKDLLDLSNYYHTQIIPASVAVASHKNPGFPSGKEGTLYACKIKLAGYY